MLLAGAFLLVLVSAASRGQRSGRGTAPGSSLRADAAGTLGARLLLERLGHRVESRRSAALPEGTGHVIVRIEALPGAQLEERPPEEVAAERAALAEWVARGNALVLLSGAADAGPAWPAVEATDAAAPGLPRLPTSPLPVPDAALAEVTIEVPDAGEEILELHSLDGVGDPHVTPGHRVAAGAGDEVILRRREADGEEAAVAVERRHGAGAAIVVADPYFASNVRIASTANGGWLAILVARHAGGGAVWFDDRAVGQAATRGVLTLLVERRLGPALAAGLALLLLGWWRLGPSDAPDRLVRPAVAYRPESLAELRAGLYAECLTAAEVGRIVRDEAARRLGRGDAAGLERGIAAVAARDPGAAQALREAVDALPVHEAVTPRRHPETWCRAVSRLWAALDEARPRRGTTVESSEEETER